MNYLLRKLVVFIIICIMICSFGYYAVWAKDNVKNESSSITTNEELKGKRVGYMIGGIYIDLFKQLNIDIVEVGFSDIMSALNALRAGKSTLF